MHTQHDLGRPGLVEYVGKYTYNAHNIRVHKWDDKYRIRIGSFCSIASNCRIYLGGNHRHDWATTFPFGHIHRDTFTTFDGTGHPAGNGDVVIGNDVWIGDCVTIMSGVTVGDGAVLAANSHVVKGVRPYEIVGGNPARHVKYRFSDDVIGAMLQIQWWNWDDEKININLPLLCNTDVSRFIETHACSNGK